MPWWEIGLFMFAGVGVITVAVIVCLVMGSLIRAIRKPKAATDAGADSEPGATKPSEQQRRGGTARAANTTSGAAVSAASMSSSGGGGGIGGGL